jgi:hypothetical protein
VPAPPMSSPHTVATTTSPRSARPARIAAATAPKYAALAAFMRTKPYSPAVFDRSAERIPRHALAHRVVIEVPIEEERDAPAAPGEPPDRVVARARHLPLAGHGLQLHLEPHGVHAGGEELSSGLLVTGETGDAQRSAGQLDRGGRVQVPENLGPWVHLPVSQAWASGVLSPGRPSRSRYSRPAGDSFTSLGAGVRSAPRPAAEDEASK